MRKVIIAYVPVLHQGYRRLLETYAGSDRLYILGKSVTGTYRHLQKELRALEPTRAAEAINGWKIMPSTVIERDELASLNQPETDIVMPDDEVSRDLAQEYFTRANVQFYPVFLRWDRRRSEAKDPIDPDAAVSSEKLHQKLIRKAGHAGLNSSNVWRRVGAALVKDGSVIAVASNQHRPTAYTPWLDGDVRGLFGKGVGIEMSTDQHAESCVIAEAARRGVALDGAELFVTTFPCPPCAMLIAYSGIKKLYYTEGYALLDGKRVLRENGVELIKVDVALPDDNPEAYVNYPET